MFVLEMEDIILTIVKPPLLDILDGVIRMMLWLAITTLNLPTILPNGAVIITAVLHLLLPRLQLQLLLLQLLLQLLLPQVLLPTLVPMTVSEMVDSTHSTVNPLHPLVEDGAAELMVLLATTVLNLPTILLSGVVILDVNILI